MIGCINGYNFKEMNAMRYWAPPATWSNEKKRDNARSKIFSGEFFGSQKMDGYFAKLVKDEDGNFVLYSRSRNVNGEYVDKHEWLPQLQPFFDALPNGTCLLGEIYFPSTPGSRNVTTVMGCLKDKAIQRQEKGEKLHLYIFDCLAFSNEIFYNKGAKYRYGFVQYELTNNFKHFDYVTFAEYKTGKDLWILLQSTLAKGGEGIVIMHKDGIYEPDKRPSKTTLKIKKELAHTIDCFFTGKGSAPTKLYTGKEIENWKYWESLTTGEKIEGTLYKDYSTGATITPITKGYFYGWCGSLEIAVLRKKEGASCQINDVQYENTEIFPIGWIGGVTEEIKANPSNYAFIPLEVTAMEWDKDNHSLRHGKIIGWRKDLPISDCTFEKIEG